VSQTTKVLVLANWVEEIESASLNKNINYCDDDFISFALGLPDANYFPTEEIKAATNFVLDNKKRMLQYHTPLS
jgi:DNA-binding transcriptional MocR family regulator